jgi:hypothetical protein
VKRRGPSIVRGCVATIKAFGESLERKAPSAFRKSAFQESRDQVVARLSRKTPKVTAVISGEFMSTRGIAQGAN